MDDYMNLTTEGSGDDPTPTTPTKPGDVAYWTCKQANAYIATMSQEIQDRYAKLQTLSGITIPDTDTVLRSAQYEIIMASI